MGPQQERSSSRSTANGGGGGAAARKAAAAVHYRECQRNHAASIGGYAVDGCREFMASGAEGTAAALLCAACACHRSFHRREVAAEAAADCDRSSTTTSAA